jgi:hypothetical protein
MFPARRTGAAHSAVIAALWLATGLLTHHAAAQADESWKVNHKLIGKPREITNENDPNHKSKDVSGIACASEAGFPRICLVADDESQGAQIVVLKVGELEAGDFIRLIYNFHKGESLELDAEGVAFANGFFYVIGSHGRPRHEDDETKEAKNKAKAQASRQLFRVGFDLREVDGDGRLAGAAQITPSTALPALIKEQPELASSFDRALDDNGLTIEGVAVRDDRLYAGMRGPLMEDGSAAILSAPLAALFDGQEAGAQLHRVDLDRRGVRDLVAFETGFLVLAGPRTIPRTARSMTATMPSIGGTDMLPSKSWARSNHSARRSSRKRLCRLSARIISCTSCCFSTGRRRVSRGKSRSTSHRAPVRVTALFCRQESRVNKWV